MQDENFYKNYIRKNSNLSSNEEKDKIKEKENKKRKTYLERELLLEMENKLIEKVFKDLSNKYNILIKEKKYNIIKFKKDLINIMKRNYNFNDPNPDYKQFFNKIEKTFLKIIYQIEDKNIYNDSELNKDIEIKDQENSFDKINLNQDGFIDYKRKFSLSSKNKSNSILINNVIKKNCKNRNEEENILNDENENEYNYNKKKFCPLKNELVRKQTFDDWAKIINSDNKKFLKQKEELKKKNYFDKSNYKNSLFEQMGEKKLIEKLKKEEENFFIKEIFQENLRKIEEKEQKNNQNSKNLLKENKVKSKKELDGN
jgi:hypothetical protein